MGKKSNRPADLEATGQISEQHQRDVWHLLHVAAQVQGRLDRAVQAEQDRLLSTQRQAEAQANGKRRRGRRPKTTLVQQEVCLAQMSYGADAVRSLSRTQDVVGDRRASVHELAHE